jgi:hypothetical protein
MSSHLWKRFTLSNQCAIAGLLLLLIALCAGCDQVGSVKTELPSSFPSDLAIFPNAKGPDVNTVPGTRVYHTTEPAAQVAQFYGDKAKNGGWDVEKTEKMSPTQTKVTITKGNLRAAVDCYPDAKKETVIEFVITQQ